MDLDRIDAVAFGRSLRGLGLNLLVADVDRAREFHQAVFGWEAFQPTRDFAILRRPDGSAVLQLHADHTYHANPLAGLLPEAGPGGAGAERGVFAGDPDVASQRTQAAGGMILQPATNKPHGLREAYILDPDGYCWVPSRPLTDAEVEAVDAAAADDDAHTSAPTNQEN
ncbi:MAG: VOC family protein [Pseudomonadota bacterium]|nr:VOC family protein [Pseudomonadota bacterium]